MNYSAIPLDADTLGVHGVARIGGRVTVGGFKHSLVTVAAAAALSDSPTSILNCPEIEETGSLAVLLNRAGATATVKHGELRLEAGGISSTELDETASRKIHGGVYLLPALIARSGRVTVPGQGGCQIGNGPAGDRPMRQYLSVFERFGATVLDNGNSKSIAASRLTGCIVDLSEYTSDREKRTGPEYSGATKMAILVAAIANGTTVLRSPYPKPDVTDLVAMLQSLGVDITRTKSGDLAIVGADGALRNSASHTLRPDLIEIITWICAGTLLGEEPLVLSSNGMADAVRALQPEMEALHKMGVSLRTAESEMTVYPTNKLQPTNLLAASHGIYSDSQPFLALLASRAQGVSTVTDTVWASKRFDYAPGLRHLGISLDLEAETLRIRGFDPRNVTSAVLEATDLRSAATLLIAAAATPGVHELTGMRHLKRGYSNLPGSLARLGVQLYEKGASHVT